MNIQQKALEYYGPKAQIEQTIEECLELALVLRHYLTCKATEEQIVSEIADVDVMLDQMKYLVGPHTVQKEKERKLKRQAERMGIDG